MDPPLLRSSSPANVLDSIAAVLTDFLVSDIPLSKAIELSHVGSFALLDLRDKAVDSLSPSCFRVSSIITMASESLSGCLVEKEVVEEDTCGRCNYWKTINRMEELNGETRAWSKQHRRETGMLCAGCTNVPEQEKFRFGDDVPDAI
ncbi:hypothetical protein GQ600_21749 [Phytophthora cactorum]|nr:hypothetical protein GQ600_21749 [Phytophthora cactorum]